MLSDCPDCGVHLGDAGHPDHGEHPHPGTPPYQFCPYCGTELDHDEMEWYEPSEGSTGEGGVFEAVRYLGRDHTRKRVTIAHDSEADSWSVRWEWQRQDGDWEIAQEVPAADEPDVNPESNGGGSLSTC